MVEWHFEFSLHRVHEIVRLVSLSTYNISKNTIQISYNFGKGAYYSTSTWKTFISSCWSYVMPTEHKAQIKLNKSGTLRTSQWHQDTESYGMWNCLVCRKCNQPGSIVQVSDWVSKRETINWWLRIYPVYIMISKLIQNCTMQNLECAERVHGSNL